MIKQIFVGLLISSLSSINCIAGNIGEVQSDGIKIVNNPIIQGLGVCDPHIHVFNDKVYLFASHDRAPGDTFYGMYDWWVWSSSDLVHWKMEYNLFPIDMWCGATRNCWAVDAAQRNGNFYFYVSGNWHTGVAVSKGTPDGPYKDALNKSLVDDYDPTVFIDDDKNKTPYIVCGHYPYKIAKLNEDMLSLYEPLKTVIHEEKGWEGDGNFLHKRNGIYYLNGHGSDYSTSTNIYGPYTYRGKFYKHWIDHPTFFTWKNQTYCAYGTRDIDGFFRKTHITYAHYKDNGEIVACGETGDSFIGVGQYDCYEKIQGENYYAASDNIIKKDLENGFYVSGVCNGSFLYFPRILNMASNSELTIKINSNSGSGRIEIRKDAHNGELLGIMKMSDTHEKFIEKTVTLKNEEGLNNIYIVYKGKGQADIDWIKFNSTGKIQEPAKEPFKLIQKGIDKNTVPVNAYKQIEAENLIAYSDLRTIDVGDSKDNSKNKGLGFLKNNSHFSYLLDFGNSSGTGKFQVRVSTPVDGVVLEMRLDSEKGELIKSFPMENTGGWNNWKTLELSTPLPKGVKHVYFVVKGDVNSGNSLLNINWFSFIDNL